MFGSFAAGTRAKSAAGTAAASTIDDDDGQALSDEGENQNQNQNENENENAGGRPPPALKQQALSPHLVAPAPVRRRTRLLASVETLARKLSLQNLQLTDSTQGRAPSSSLPSPSEDAPELPLPDLTTRQRSPIIEIDDCYKRPAQPHLPFSSRDRVSPLSIDEHIASRHHESFLPDPMDLQSDPATMSIDNTIEPEPASGPDTLGMLPTFDLDVDEAYCGGNDDRRAQDEASPIGSFRVMRRATTPGGPIRRHVDGIPLRYRLSAEVAMSCPNAVRQRPRMRKRKMVRRRLPAPSSSVASSLALTDDASDLSMPYPELA